MTVMENIRIARFKQTSTNAQTFDTSVIKSRREKSIKHFLSRLPCPVHTGAARKHLPRTLISTRSWSLFFEQGLIILFSLPKNTHIYPAEFENTS